MKPLLGAVRKMVLRLRFNEEREGFDEGQVGECLREIPQVLAGGSVDLLGIKVQWPGQRQQLLGEGARPFDLADHGQRAYEPEGADREGALFTGEPGVRSLDSVAQDKAVFGEVVGD